MAQTFEIYPSRADCVDYLAEYSPEHGASCPCCGESTLASVSRLPWKDGMKLRYHRCQKCGYAFKSYQIDPAHPIYKKRFAVDGEQ